MPDDTLPATAPEIDLDAEAAEVHRLATLAAIAQWNRLPEFRKARVSFDRLVETQRQRLARERGGAA